MGRIPFAAEKQNKNNKNTPADDRWGPRAMVQVKTQSLCLFPGFCRLQVLDPRQGMHV